MRHQRAGFSLLELMVASAIFTIIFLAIMALWDVGWSSFETAEAQTIVNQELRKGLDCMIAEVTEGGAHTITDVPADDTWHDSLTFRRAEAIVNGNPVWSTDTIRYAVGGPDGVQLLRVSGKDQRMVAANILLFRVRRSPATPNVVEFSLRGYRDPLSAKGVESNSQFKVMMRN